MKALGDFSVTASYETRFHWVDNASGDAGFLLMFDVKGETDAGVIITDDEEVGDTREGPASMRPVFFIRFANYRNSKTLIERRGHGLACRKHDKLLSPHKYVTLWVNVRSNKMKGVTSISCGTGAPCRATALLSRTDVMHDRLLTRIGFTSWNSDLDFRRVRVHHSPLHEIHVWAPVACRGHAPRAPESEDTVLVSCATGSRGGSRVFRCQRLALLCSGKFFNRVCHRQHSGTRTEELLTSLKGSVLVSVEHSDTAIHITFPESDVLSDCDFEAWYRGILRGAVPVSFTSTLFGTDPHNLQKMQLKYYLATDGGDVTMLCRTCTDSTSLRAHLGLLLRNEYIAAMFTGDSAVMSEESSSSQLVFDLQVCDRSRPLGHVLLEALYCSGLGYDFNDLSGVLPFLSTYSLLAFTEECKKYGVHSAVSFSQHLLSSRINDKDPLPVQELVLLCDAASYLPLPALRQNLVAYLVRNFSSVLVSSTERDHLLSLPVDVLAEVTRLEAQTLKTAPAQRVQDFTAAYIKHNIEAERLCPTSDEMWISELHSSFSEDERTATHPDDSSECDVDAVSVSSENSDDDIPSTAMRLKPGSHGVFGICRERIGGNPVRSGLVTVRSSSPKNPLSAGWKLFAGTPKILCTATAANPKPFLHFVLNAGMSLGVTHYEIKLGAYEDSLRSWGFFAKATDSEQWACLDRRVGQHTLSSPYASAVFEVQGLDAASEFKIVREDEQVELMVAQVELYGVLHNASLRVE